MTAIHFTLRLRRRRDLLIARHRARRLTALLGFSSIDQARISAAVFALASAAYQTTPAALRFDVNDEAITVAAMSPRRALAVPAVRQRLPVHRCLASEDVGWAMKQLVALAPFRAFEEIQRLNADVLLLSRELSPSEVRPSHAA